MMMAVIMMMMMTMMMMMMTMMMMIMTMMALFNLKLVYLLFHVTLRHKSSCYFSRFLKLPS